MSKLVDFLTPGARSLQKYAERLTKDIPEGIFATKPIQNSKLIEMTHPAFNFGHLACYPKKILGLVGIMDPDLKVPEEFYQKFVKGSVCEHDPEGKIYPSKATILEAFFSGYDYTLTQLNTVDEVKFDEVNPWPDSVDRFPTVGAFICYLVSGHLAGHLGQVSSWRRSFELPPV